MGRGVGEDVADDPHRGAGRINVGVPHHELFEDVVLDRAGEFFRRHALLLGGHDVERHDGQHRPVHRHGDAHPVEGNARKERAHVVDRVDGNPRHADIARDARVVRIVAAMGREVEGDRKALLARREIAPVEGVRVLRGGEAGVLPDRPRLVDVHGRVGAAQIRRQARKRVEEIEPLAVRGAVLRLDRNALGREPGLSRYCSQLGERGVKGDG